MNSEHVRELLSEYLDNMLAAEDRRRVAAHLQTCPACSEEFADMRRLDALLRSQPRVGPPPSLRERIFSSPAYLALTGTQDARDTVPRHSAVAPHEEQLARPRLVALPGGRQTPVSSSDRSTRHAPVIQLPHRKRKTPYALRIMQAMIAAAVLLTLGVGSLIGWNLWQEQHKIAHDPNAITPPAGPQQGLISAGTRFVFLRDGALWSGATDGTTGVLRLTPPSVTVAQRWIVRPALPGRRAGDLLAYIDLQKGYIHTIRSDGQRDTTIQQPLLKPGVQPTSLWDTDLGNMILASLAWSSDGNQLAFVADPTGSNQPALFVASLNTGQVNTVPLPTPGAVSHLVWSPDGVRIAFALSYNGDMSILDYNTQNHGILTIAASSHTPTYASDTILALDWSPNTQMPEITWSTGLAANGHTHNIWSRRVGVGTTTAPLLLATGDYTQAAYSRTGQNSTGNWLLVTGTRNTESLAQLDLNANSVHLTSKPSIAFASWSPDGATITYFEATTQQTGVLHRVSLQTGLDVIVASQVLFDPAPAWSTDNLHFAYSTSTGVFVADTRAAQSAQLPTLHVPASAFAWSSSDPQQLIVSTSGDQQGIYLLNAQSHAIQHLDTSGIHGPLLWTEIP